MKVLVDEFTTPSPVTCQASVQLNEVEELMRVFDVRHMPVLDGEKLVGLISDRDLKMVGLSQVGQNLSVNEVMSGDVFVANDSSALEDVVFAMSQRKIGSAVVVDDDNKVTGIFTVTDALNALLEVLRGDILSR